MLAGLMGATVLGGIAPAYAQNEPRERGNRAERPDGGQRGGGNWNAIPIAAPPRVSAGNSRNARNARPCRRTARHRRRLPPIG